VRYNVIWFTFFMAKSKNSNIFARNRGVLSMDERRSRGPGGMLALWVFYAFCGYFIWAMLRYFWVVSQIDPIPGATLDGDLGSTMGKWLGALLGFVVLSSVGAILGGIAWYTRPRGEEPSG
jgi:hypothetical protein